MRKPFFLVRLKEPITRPARFIIISLKTNFCVCLKELLVRSKCLIITGRKTIFYFVHLQKKVKSFYFRCVLSIRKYLLIFICEAFLFLHILYIFLYSTNFCHSLSERFLFCSCPYLFFFLFLLEKDFDIFHDTYFVVFICYFDNIYINIW